MYACLKRIGLDWFILSIGACIFAAWLYPPIGVDREPVSLGDVATAGVSLIFFFYGLRLNRGKLKEGLRNVRLHCAIHAMTFLVFPLIVLAAVSFVDMSPKNPHYYQWLGVFFLAALPSTVSSSVVMVSIAGGNIPAAIFNASVSSLLGVFLTPLWMGVFVGASNGGYGFGETVLKLVFQVLLPVSLGLALNPVFGGFAQRHRTALKYSDQLTILLIIYTSFCQAFADGMFDGYSALNLLVLAAGVVAMFFVLFFIIYAFARAMKFSREDTITALFCGSKKSLVHGSVMSKVIFSSSAVAGIVLLPTMIYHAAQLVIASAVANFFAGSGRKA